MPTDQPGLEMRRMLAKLLAEHGEQEVRGAAPDHVLNSCSSPPPGQGIRI
jgi:hypothetical protein